MPLTIDGKKPKYTGQRLGCPLCGKPVFGICGKIRIWHWRHHIKSNCAYGKETIWHLAWKAFFSDRGCVIEQVVIVNGVKRIADVILENSMVIEIQNIPDPDTFLDRCCHYGMTKIAWIFRSPAIDVQTTGITSVTIEGELKVLGIKGTQKRLKLIIEEASRSGVPIFLDTPDGLFWIYQATPTVIGLGVEREGLLPCLAQLTCTKSEIESVIEAKVVDITTQIQTTEHRMDVLCQESLAKLDELGARKGALTEHLVQVKKAFDEGLPNDTRTFLAMLRTDQPLLSMESIKGYITKSIELASGIHALRIMRADDRAIFQETTITTANGDETSTSWSECRSTLASLRQEHARLQSIFGKGELHREKIYPAMLPKCEWVLQQGFQLSPGLADLLKMSTTELKDMLSERAKQLAAANYIEPSKLASFYKWMDEIANALETGASIDIPQATTPFETINKPSTSDTSTAPISATNREPPVKGPFESVVSQAQPRSRGFCIRCREPIGLAPRRPLCLRCYRIWAIYENPAYIERFCHACGRPMHSTMDQPLCNGCETRDGSSKGGKHPTRSRVHLEGRILH